MNERGSFRGKVSGELFLGLERVEVQGLDNLETVRTHLQTGSVVGYFDHFARLDSVVYGKVVKDHITTLDNVASWVAIKYVDEDRNPVIARLLKWWQEEYGFKLFPIVQPERYDKKRNQYESPDKTNMNSFRQALDFLREPGHMLVVAPEGTRSHTKQLLKAEPGFEMLLKKSPDSLVLPIAGVHSWALPVASKTVVKVGEPFTYQEILHEQVGNSTISITDLAMKRLANLLPQANRGYYA